MASGCSDFDEIRMKMTLFFKCLQEIRNNGEYAEIHDLGNLKSEIQKDYRLGFSTVSFLRRAISQRENFRKDSCCVRGRLCASPGHWTRDLLRHPPCAAELPDDLE